jgi:hypothetical protein
MTVQNYSTEVFNSLETLGNSYSKLGSEDKLSILGDIILKYRLENVVGLCLLHRHVDLQPSERLIERFEIDRIFIEPKNIEDKSIEQIPYSFKLVYNSNLKIC